MIIGYYNIMSKNNYYLGRIALASLLLAVISISTTFAAFDLTKWQSYRELDVPSQAGFVKVTLPETVSSGGNNFSDIRIITQGDSVEVPYFITRNAVVRSGERNAQILDQTTLGGASVFIVDTGEQGMIHTGIRFVTSSKNYRRMVGVFSSPSLVPINSPSWNGVTDKGYIFKFTDPNTGFTSGKDNIDIPANTSRYLEIIISDGEEGPVSVGQVSVYGETKIDVPSYSKKVSVTTFNNPKNKSTEIVLDLEESGHITNAITLSSSDKNFTRRVIVESADNASSTWTYVCESSISGISTTRFTGTSLKIPYPEQKTRFIRVSIVNDDNRPLVLGNTATLEGPIVSAIFETRTGESYRLYYGNPQAQTPTYDIGRISAYIETNKLPAGSIEAESVNPLYVAPPPPVVPFTEANSNLLNIFLVIVVILIGGGIGWYLVNYMKNKGGTGGFDMEEKV